MPRAQAGHLLRPAHLRTPAQSASAHPRLNYPWRLDVKHGAWRVLFFQKQQVETIWRGAIIRLLRASYDRVNPGKLPNLLFGASPRRDASGEQNL
ncbi:putative transposase [Candidatus Erwinia dacicola]|uniref:Transposase n=1 Tax=Candidatus Erwinia dacicola TaxID=252393 RepID=A0A328TP85_9GAMM|nr:putative transposase [Candidatus Erwinia dacicola]